MTMATTRRSRRRVVADISTKLQPPSSQVVETIQEEMLKKEGFTWPISVGFHAVESLAHVHL